MLSNLLKCDSIDINNEYEMRLFQHVDIQYIKIILDDIQVNKYLAFANPIEVFEGYFGSMVDGMNESINKNEIPENIIVTIIEKSTRIVVGNGGISSVMFCPGNFEVGYQLAPSVWGKGIATQCCKMLIQMTFTELNGYKVNADLYGQNKGSMRVLEKAGLVKEGEQMDYYKIDEDCFDSRLLYGITKSMFDKL